MSRKLFAKPILLYATFTACCLAFFATMDGALSFGVFVGAIYSANPVIAYALYLASSVIFGLPTLINTAIRGGVLVAVWFIYKLLHKKIGKGALVAYCVLANVFYLTYDFQGYFQLFDKVVYVCCGVAFALICVYVFRALFVRGLAYSMALDEKLCVAIWATVAIYCLSQKTVLGFDVTYFVAPFCILFCQTVFGDKTALVSSIVMGVGNIFATGTYNACAFCVICCLAVITLAKLNRFVASLGVIVVDILMSYFLNLHGRFDTLVFAPTVVSTFVFVVIPNVAYNYLKDVWGGGGNKYVNQAITQKYGNSLSRRLYRLSDIFLSMKNAFFAMSVGAISSQQATNAVVKECSERVCQDCNFRTRCWRQDLSQTEQSLLQLASCAVERGKCSILDVPQSLSAKCSRISAVISQVNTQAQCYREYAERTEQSLCNRTLLGEQMGGVSGLLLQLATDCKSRINFDTDKQQELAERLIFHNVMCVGASIVWQSNVLSVTVTVSRKDVDKPTIEQVCSALFKQNMKVDKVEQTDSPSWVNVSLSVQPRFEVTFGVATVPKYGNEISGDTHSQIDTDNGKCIVALCDGMGSGNKAEQTSSMAITLIENFYRAGFDSDVILSCVNKVLTSCNNEVFCALDVVVLDKYNGLADFVKLGATMGLVKTNNSVQIINGSSLPLGVLDEMKPSVTKLALNSGDVVVLMSDGVVDCFADGNSLASVFWECSCATAQTVAQTIIQRAIKLCNNKPADDMSVVVAKII